MVFFYGNFYWFFVLLSFEIMVVFDMVVEVFWFMFFFVVYVNSLFDLNVKLFDMDGVFVMLGSCSEVIGDDGFLSVDLWFLEDYNDCVWVCKYCIELLVEDISCFYEFEDVWNVVVVFYEGDVLVDFWNCLLGYDSEGNLVVNLLCDCSLLEIGLYMFK